MADDKIVNISEKQFDELVNGELFLNDGGHVMGQYTIIEPDLANETFKKELLNVFITSTLLGKLRDDLVNTIAGLTVNLTKDKERLVKVDKLRAKYESLLADK